MRYSVILLCSSILIGCEFPEFGVQNKHIEAMYDELYEDAMVRLSEASSSEERFYALGDAAKSSVDVGKIEDAQAYAEELRALMPSYEGNWNYGNAIAAVHIVLGRIALQDGSLEDAKTHLHAAGNSPGSPQMNSFGPNMSLAKDLLEAGEQEAVLEYFEQCRVFWEMGHGELDQWRSQVQNGNIPAFGANLIY